MHEFRNNYDRVRKYEQAGKKLSEIDTQVILVEPVLRLAGYDISNPFVVKRASRNTHSEKSGDKWIGEFDVEVYDEGKLKIAIEVKSLSGFGFDITKISDTKSLVGKLYIKDGWWWREEKRVYDDIGQLRAYCINYSSFIKGTTLPVITNGNHWILFGKNFIDNPARAVSLDNILAHGFIEDSDFYDKIVKNLK